MKFEYQKNESIPSLSWLAEINESGGELELYVAQRWNVVNAFLCQEYGMAHLKRESSTPRFLFMGQEEF